MLYKGTIMAVQVRLQKQGGYRSRPDGERGAALSAAVKAALAERVGELPQGYERWSAKRRLIAYLQLWCKESGINSGDVDGHWGPQTDFAVDALMETIETGRDPELWRDEVSVPGNPRGWPKEKDIQSFFGPPGRVNNAPSPPPPLVNVPSPWPLKIAWDLRHRRKAFKVHEKVADSLGEILEKVHAHYGETEIEKLGLDLFGGDYNARLKRGGSTMSMHSWGIAIDFDPANNRLKWNRDRARLARTEYEDWWRIWEAEGWVSLGRARNFDWMHVQAARLREG